MQQTDIDFEISLRRPLSGVAPVELRTRHGQEETDSPMDGLRLDEGLRQDLLAAADPESYGRRLGQALLAGPLLRRLNEKLGATGPGRRLRLCLKIARDAPELQALRWETLAHPETGAALATDHRVRFARFLSSAADRPPRLPRRGRIRAVAAIAAPSGLEPFRLAPIDLAAELATARAGLAGMELTVLGEAAATTREALLAALQPGSDVLYLVAHGGLLPPEQIPGLPPALAGQPRLPSIFLQDQQRRARPIAARDLFEDLAQPGELPRLAILVSCRSADPESAEALAWLLGEAGVPAVLAMQGDLQMETARHFLPALLAALQRDEPLEVAVAAGRTAARAAGCLDWWMPALFSRLGEGRIWQAPEPQLVEQLWALLLRQPVARTLSEAQLRQLAEALLACPGTRLLPLAELGGLDDLVVQLYHLEPAGSEPLARLQQLLGELGLEPPIEWRYVAELERLLARADLTLGELSQCYYRSRPYRELPAGRDPADTLALAVRQLAGARIDREQRHPLVDFVRQLADELPRLADPLRHSLHSWAGRVGDWLGLAGQPEPAAAPAAALVVQLALAPGVVEVDREQLDSLKVVFSAWLLAPGLDPQPLAATLECSLEQARAHFASARSQALARAGVASDELPLEFVLPLELLLEPLEGWEERPRMRWGRPSPVSRSHPVVVRSADRLAPDNLGEILPDWRRRWQRRAAVSAAALADAAAREQVAVLVDDRGYTFDQIDSKLSMPERVLLLQTTDASDGPRIDILGQALGKGYPIALILREDLGDPRQLAEGLARAMAGGRSLDDLPRLVQAERIAAGASGDRGHHGQALTLLWDDPERMPPRAAYTGIE